MHKLKQLLFLLLPFAAILGFEFALQRKLQFHYGEWHRLITGAQYVLYFWATIAVMATGVKRKSDPLVSGSIFLLLFLVVDLVFFFIMGMPAARQQFYLKANRPGHISYDVGAVPYPNDTTSSLKILDGDTVFNVTYITDEFHRRHTPGHKPENSQYAAFFGCSVCFGFGLEEDETLPALLQKNTCNINAYNFGNNGWGMHHMLARFEHEDLSKTVDEQDGIGVYVFLWSHIRRAIGDMKIYTGWGHSMPHFTMEGGKLVRRGNFKNGRFWRSSLYTLVNSSFAARYFKVNLPLETDAADYDLAAEIILEAKKAYIEQFGNDRFYVLIHPILWKEFTDERKFQFIEILEEKGIEYLDYSEAYPINNDHKIVGDGHPNAFANDKIMKLLIQDLKLSTAPCDTTKTDQ